MKKKIHINQHIIRSNKKNGTTLPVITVKNTLFLLYPNRSGVPKELEFSILVHKILGVNFFHSCQNFASGFRVTKSFSKPCPFAKIPG